jgi:hypothetical protein
MTLLKDDDSVPKKLHTVSIASWPIERLPQGLGLSFSDGWYFGIGLGLALTVAVPIILLITGFIIGIILMIAGML